MRGIIRFPSDLAIAENSENHAAAREYSSGCGITKCFGASLVESENSPARESRLQQHFYPARVPRTIAFKKGYISWKKSRCGGCRMSSAERTCKRNETVDVSRTSEVHSGERKRERKRTRSIAEEKEAEAVRVGRPAAASPRRNKTWRSSDTPVTFKDLSSGRPRTHRWSTLNTVRKLHDPPESARETRARDEIN